MILKIQEDNDDSINDSIEGITIKKDDQNENNEGD